MAQSISDSQTSAAERSPFSVGIYAGELYKAPFISIFHAPQDIHLTHSYLAAVDFDYRFYKFDPIPVQLEGEVDIAKRFLGQNGEEFEFNVAPFLRWTYFPWNSILYTNVRVGILGLSYATGIAPWEKQNSGNSTGSNILHFLVSEVTFAAKENASGEAFIRVHHRSGVYGLFNGVQGGSSYLSAGYRIFW